jgi:hypothetical protein
MPAPRQLPKGARLVHIHGGDCQGEGFEGCSAAEVRLYLTLQGRLDTRQKAPFDRIKGARSRVVRCNSSFLIRHLNSKVLQQHDFINTTGNGASHSRISP